MSKINSILSQRLQTTQNPAKMAALAKKSAEGGLSSFAGVFAVGELTQSERQRVTDLLQNYQYENQEISSDVKSLCNITAEVKAITNQAAILHGERIKRAQAVLKNYKEGAFSAWLLSTYGNRQTPYNFLQYFEFYAAMPKHLHVLIETMPRQAVYTLASRSGSLQKKEEIVRQSEGKSKEELLNLIRQLFPLDKEDGRNTSSFGQTLTLLKKAAYILKCNREALSKSEKNSLASALKDLIELL